MLNYVEYIPNKKLLLERKVITDQLDKIFGSEIIVPDPDQQNMKEEINKNVISL